MSGHWHAIEAAFNQLGWNMTPVHMARAREQELEVVVKTAYHYYPKDTPMSDSMQDAIAVERCPVCEGLDQPGLMHNPEAPYCSQNEGCDTNPITDWGQ